MVLNITSKYHFFSIISYILIQQEQFKHDNRRAREPLCELTKSHYDRGSFSDRLLRFN